MKHEGSRSLGTMAGFVFFCEANFRIHVGMGRVSH